MSGNQQKADTALKNRLYVSGWCLSHILRGIRDGQEDGTVFLHYVDNTPVGVAVLLKYGKHMFKVAVFVKKSHRGNGIGRKLINHCKRKSSGKPITHGSGIVGSMDFFEKTLN